MSFWQNSTGTSKHTALSNLPLHVPPGCEDGVVVGGAIVSFAVPEAMVAEVRVVVVMFASMHALHNIGHICCKYTLLLQYDAFTVQTLLSTAPLHEGTGNGTDGAADGVDRVVTVVGMHVPHSTGHDVRSSTFSVHSSSGTLHSSAGSTNPLQCALVDVDVDVDVVVVGGHLPHMYGHRSPIMLQLFAVSGATPQSA